MRQSRILIVDDNQRNTAIVKKVLRGPYLIADASDGEEALTLAESFRPDVVLLDIMLPGIDGYEVCRRIKETQALTNTKVIMVTAKAMMGEKLAGYQAGADDYVTKPFDGDELFAKVEVYLRLKTVEEHEALKTNLLTLLGHEARTPLTYMISAAEALKTMGLEEGQREFADMIHEGAARIASLITKILRYGEVSSRSRSGSSSMCDLTGVLEASVANALEKARKKSVTVATSLRASAQVEADSAQLTEAVEIILGNAIDVSPPKETVSIHTAESDDDVIIVVRDNGPGIQEELLSSLFDGLNTPDVAHHSKGDGMSLAIARAIVEAHGGGIEVSSEKGCGTSFTIRLPLCKETSLR